MLRGLVLALYVVLFVLWIIPVAGEYQ